MADEHEGHRLKNLLSTPALTVWHDHPDICGEHVVTIIWEAIETFLFGYRHFFADEFSSLQNSFIHSLSNQGFTAALQVF